MKYTVENRIARSNQNHRNCAQRELAFPVALIRVPRLWWNRGYYSDIRTDFHRPLIPNRRQTLGVVHILLSMQEEIETCPQTSASYENTRTETWCEAIDQNVSGFACLVLNEAPKQEHNEVPKINSWGLILEINNWKRRLAFQKETEAKSRMKFRRHDVGVRSICGPRALRGISTSLPSATAGSIRMQSDAWPKIEETHSMM